MNYAVIGQGKLASHLYHWLKLEDKTVSIFSKNDDFSSLESSDVVLLAIPDRAIEPFYLKHSGLISKKWIHFSGACSFKEIIGIHPMMSFSTELFEKDFYRGLRWVTTHDIPFAELLPIKSQQVSLVSEKDKKHYHALCVLAGNIPHLLWRSLEDQFLNLGIEQDDILKYVQVSTENYLKKRPVTGPIARKDVDTIQSNLSNLSQNHADIYQSVLEICNE